jgi:hypothetical protein
MIAITRWEFKQPREALRVVSVAMEALHQLGISNPARHFILVSDGALNEDGRPVLVLGKRSEFTADEEALARKHVQGHSKLVAQYFPGQPGQNAFSRLIATNDAYAFACQYRFNVAPDTDDAPFFFFTLKLGQMVNGDVEEGMDWKVNLGVVVLGMVLLLSVLAVLGFLILPLLLRGRGRSVRAWPLAYFIALGLAYILVEITFIQRFVLFLGHPTYALTVVVFLLLLSSGVGSITSRRWLPDSAGRLSTLIVASAVLAYAFLLPGVLPSLIGLPLLAKLAISAFLLAPLGFVMGMPFPLGLRALAGASAAGLPPADCSSENSIEWAWAMNAAASVLGSVLAIAIGVRFGLKVTLLCGAAAYLAASMLFRSLESGRSPRWI